MIANLERAGIGDTKLTARLCREEWSGRESFTVRVENAGLSLSTYRHASYPLAVADWRERTQETRPLASTAAWKDSEGHAVESIWYDPPVPLAVPVESTTVIQGQAREVGQLPAGTLVRRVSQSELGAHAWLEVSTDGGKTWWGNERATDVVDVTNALARYVLGGKWPSTTGGGWTGSPLQPVWAEGFAAEGGGTTRELGRAQRFTLAAAMAHPLYGRKGWLIRELNAAGDGFANE